MWRDPPADGQPGKGAEQEEIWDVGGDVENGATPVNDACS